MLTANRHFSMANILIVSNMTVRKVSANITPGLLHRAAPLFSAELHDAAFRVAVGSAFDSPGRSLARAPPGYPLSKIRCKFQPAPYRAGCHLPSTARPAARTRWPGPLESSTERHLGRCRRSLLKSYIDIIISLYHSLSSPKMDFRVLVKSVLGPANARQAKSPNDELGPA